MAPHPSLRPEAIARRKAVFDAARTAAEVAELQRTWDAEDAATAANESSQAREIAALRATVAKLQDKIARLERALKPGGKFLEPLMDGVGAALNSLRKEFAELEIDYNGERTLTFRCGAQQKSFTLPIPLDRGVYRTGQAYEKGDVVTYGGSLWIATVDCTGPKPGDGAMWRLAVKHGRDGKPAKGL